MTPTNHPPRLSFCIPTLNRGAVIGQTLDSILRQATEDIEIVVVDGASSDNTEAVIRSYSVRYPFVRYFRRDKNMGVDRDMSKSVELAEGDYCWLFPDDDTLEDGAVRRVMSALKDDPSLVVVNTSVYNSDLRDELLPRVMSLQSDRTYLPSECEELFSATVSHLSYMGAVVIRRSLWNDREKEKYFGTEFIHVGVIFQADLPRPAHVIVDPLIRQRYGVSMWSSRNFEVSVLKWPLLIRSFENITLQNRERLSCPASWENTKVLLYRRARGSYSFAQYCKHLHPLRAGVGQKIKAVLVSITPGSMVNLAAIFYYSKIRRSEIALTDLRSSRFYFWNWNRQRRGPQANPLVKG